MTNDKLTLTKMRFSITTILLLTTYSLLGQDHFSNPILPSGADPWMIQKDGYYYYTHTTGKNLVLYKTKNFAGLASADQKIIWEPPVGTSYSRQIWAPELHFLNGKWYFYFAADDGNNKNHRMYVLENSSADPMTGTWELKGRVSDATNKWAIDGTVFRHRNRWYMMWSGWEGDTNGRQDIFMARMKNPWTIRGSRVRISSPNLSWERHGDLNDADNPPHVAVNEGPQILRNKKRLFIVYSASGCWTDNYGLGMLTFTGKRNILDSASWVKSPSPVFETSAKDSVFAPGHNSFFKSPDGTQDWILYHANNKPGEGCGVRRSPRAQKFSWNTDGTPYFGTPLQKGLLVAKPSEKN